MRKSHSKIFSLYDSGLVLSSVEMLPNTSASVAFTVDSGKVFREDVDMVPVTLSNGILYMPWGADNQMPYHVTIKYNYSVADFCSINTDEEYCFQGSEADDVIKQIADIWNTSEITQDEAISQWISMHL